MSRGISIDEVKQHGNNESAWIIIHNDVYDVTQFLNEHPGGDQILLEYAGKDASQAFESANHSDSAKELMKKYKIGSLSQAARSSCGFVPYQKNLVVLPIDSNECCTPDPKRVPKKTWRTYDGSPGRKSRDGSPVGGRAGVKTPLGAVPQSEDGNKGPCQHCDVTTQHYRHPRPEDRVKSIIVPRERCTRTRRSLSEPTFDPSNDASNGASNGKMKWAIIILASAIVVAMAIKKYKG